MKPSVQDKLVLSDADASPKHSAMKQKLREKSQDMAFEFGLDKPFPGSFGKTVRFATNCMEPIHSPDYRPRGRRL